MAAGRACAPISACVSLSITSWLVSRGQSIQIQIMWGKSDARSLHKAAHSDFWALFARVTFTCHKLLSSFCQLFQQCHIYCSSGAVVAVLAEQGACVCRAQVRRLLNLHLKCWLHPKRFFLCDWKPWHPGHPSSGDTSECRSWWCQIKIGLKCIAGGGEGGWEVGTDPLPNMCCLSQRVWVGIVEYLVGKVP